MRKFFQFALPAFICVALFGITIFFLILPKMEDAIMAKKRETTRELVRTVIELLGTYQADVDNGLVDLDEARKRAVKRIQHIRYGFEMKDYFWINDLTPRMIMHPYRSDLNNKGIADFTDANGKKIFVEFVKQSRKPEGGFVEYLWQHHDDPNEIVPKISYVALFRPWGWIIGSGLYYDDVKIEIARLTRTLTVVGFGIFILVALLSGYLAWRGFVAMNENRLMMEALQRSEAKFRGISDSANDGIIMITPEGTVSFWNKAAERIFGYRADEIKGAKLHKLLAPMAENQKYEAAVVRFREEGDGFAIGKTLELPALHKDGTKIPIELSVSALNFDGEWHAVGIVRDISEKKKAQADLQESETKYRTLFDSTNDIILLMEDDIIVDCNARAEEFFNAERESIVGKTPIDFSPEFQGEGVYSRTAGNQYINLANKNEPQHFEWIHKDFKNDPIYTDVVLKKITLLGKEMLMAVCRDITMRKQTEAVLQEREKEYRSTLNNLQIGVVVHADDTSILFSNPEAARILGLTSDQMSGKKAIDPEWNFVHEDLTIMRVEEYPVCRVLSTKRTIYDTIFGIKRPDRKEITWVIVNAIPVFAVDSEIEKIIVNFIDYTSRRQAEEQLQQNESLLNTTQQLAKIGGWEVDLDKQVTFWTDEVYRIHDLQTDKFTSREKNKRYPSHGNRSALFTFSDEAVKLSLECYDPEDRPAVIDAFKKCIEKGQPYDFELPFTSTEGCRKWIRTTANPVMEDNRVVKVVGNIMDITARKQAEEARRNLEIQLQQSQKLEAVGTLAAGIAHDFNNVLWGILGFSEMAIRQIPSEPEKATKSMEQVLKAGNRAKYMVQQILQFSRQSEIAMGPLELNSILKEVTKLLQATIPSNFEISLKISGGVHKVHADATQIHQVLMNLCTNAYHAMQQFNKGFLSLSLDRVETASEIKCYHQSLPAGSYICIQISDTGHGIETENLNKIFDPYYTTKKKGEGTGLGLAVSFGIITSHKGGIQIESRQGEGSTFSIYLPPKDDDFVEIISYDEKIIGGMERILYVDDETAFLEMTENILTDVGYAVTGFDSSLEAWKFFSNHPDRFDLVITDQTMPQMTGLELAAKISKVRPIPIILCTGFSENIIQSSIEQSGIVLILKKPLLRKELTDAIRKVLDESSEEGNHGKYTDC